MTIKMIRISQVPKNAPNMGSNVIFIPPDTEAKPAGCYWKNIEH